MTLTKGPSNTFYPAQVDASKNKLIISCQQLQNMASTQDASASGGDEFGPQGPRAPDVMMGWVLFGLDQKNAEEHSLELWWHFQLGWTRTNQEVSQYIRGFFMLQSSHWHGPCTRYDTQPFGWLKKRRPLVALGFSPGWGLAGYEPKCSGAWVISAGAQRWTVEGGSCVVRRLMNGWIA